MALLAITSVWPSGGDLATRSTAKLPPLPVTFSTRTDLLQAAENFSASSRAATSGGPPGGKPTMM